MVLNTSLKFPAMQYLGNGKSFMFCTSLFVSDPCTSSEIQRCLASLPLDVSVLSLECHDPKSCLLLV